jgi:hypothetical protein
LSNFFIGVQDPVTAISKNPSLQIKLQEIVAKLDGYSQDDLEALNEIHSLLQEACDLITKDKNIPNHSPFPQFIQGVMKSIDVSIAKVAAQAVLQELRSEIEERFQEHNTSSTLSAGASLDEGVMHAGLGVGRTTGQKGTGENALLEMSAGYGISVNVGVGQRDASDALKASLDLTARFDLIFTSIYFSIEQLIDSGVLDLSAGDSMKERIFDSIKKHIIDKFSIKKEEERIVTTALSEAREALTETLSETLSVDKSQNETIRNVTSARRKMQDTEREFSRSAGNVENFLRMVGTVSHSDHVKRPHVTRADAPLQKTTASAKVTISGELSTTFAALGLEASTGASISRYKTPRHYLALLKDDCSPNAKLTAEEVRTATGDKKYDHSKKYLDASNQNESASINMLSSHLHEYNSVLQSLADSKGRKVDIATEIKRLDGIKKPKPSEIKQLEDLQKQLKSLTESRKELKARKHKCEEQLSPEKGRIGVFKSCIVTAAKIREQAKTEPDNPSFRRMFQELETLESLLEFSKDEQSRSGTSMQKANSHAFDGEISGTFKAGNASVTFQGNDRSGSPFQNENGTFMSVSLSVASDTVAKLIEGGGVVGDWLKSDRVSLTEQSHGEGIREELLPDEGDSKTVTVVAMAKSALSGALELKEAIENDSPTTEEDEDGETDEGKDSGEGVIGGIKSRIDDAAEDVVRVVGGEERANRIAEGVKGGVDRAASTATGIVDKAASTGVGKTAAGIVDRAANAAAGTVGKVLQDIEDTSRDLPESETEVKVQFVRIEPSAQTKDTKPLPGRQSPIKRDRPQWVPLYSECTVTTNSEEGKQATIVGTGGAVTAKVGKSERTQESRIQQLGMDTMRHITSIFDRGQRGDSTVWETLKEDHGKELSKMLENLTNANSNISYELQGLYNDILKNVGADTELGEQCTEVFGKLLEDCKKLSEGEIDLETALASLDEVLTLNYEHNSRVHFEQAFSIKSKTPKPKTPKKHQPETPKKPGKSRSGYAAL